MDQYRKVMQHLEEVVPSGLLYRRIVARIHRAEQKRARLRLGCATLGTLLSCVVFIPVFNYFVLELVQSGVTQYISLVLSDGGLLLASWQEFLLSLAESLPITGISLLLGIIFLFLGSLRLASHYTKTAFGSLQVV